MKNHEIAPHGTTSRRRARAWTMLIASALGLNLLLPIAFAHAGKSGRVDGTRGAIDGTTTKSQGNPIVRDHRGSDTHGGVTVKDGKPRPRGGLCAGWGCPQ